MKHIGPEWPKFPDCIFYDACTMIEKKNFLKSLQALLVLEEAMVSLCDRQVGNAAFFSGIPPQNRPDVHAGLAEFVARSQQHRQALENLIGSIASGGRDVF